MKILYTILLFLMLIIVLLIFSSSENKTQEILYSAIGSVLGFGLLFVIWLFLENTRSGLRVNSKITYYVVNDLNRGIISGAKEGGHLSLVHGEIVNSDVAKRQYKHEGGYPLWRLIKPTVSQAGGDNIFYGPYTMIFSEPGRYCARYYIRAFNLKIKDTKIRDINLFYLDVNHITNTNKDHTISDGKERKSLKLKIIENIETTKHEQVAKKIITYKQLKEIDGWKKPFDLYFYSDASGLWEFRANMYPHYLQLLYDNYEILFDRVEIMRYVEPKLPWI